MTEAKNYEAGAFSFEFTPQGDPYVGDLMTMSPEQEPYAGDISLSKKRSRTEYANDAVETWGMEKGSELAKDLKKALNTLYVRRREEVEAASEAEQEADLEETYPEVSQEEIGELVGQPGVLNRYCEDAAKIHGVVGESEPLRLLSLNALGAQLEQLPNGKPLGPNVVLTAVWGRGKNHLCDAVATPLPDDFYLAFESASAKALYYRAEKDPRVLAHCWIYLNEVEAMDQLVEILRPLLSSGRASHLTVNKDSDGQSVAQELRVEGPVTVTIPTIKNKLDPQLQSRLLTAELPDYEGRVARHSRATSRLLLPGYTTEDYSPLIRAWQAALRELTELRRVVFALDKEEFCFDSDRVSHGARVWGNILGLMCTHAWLEQRNREAITLPNGEQAIAATPADYEAAYNIFKATCERSVLNISETHRKILDALYELKTENQKMAYSVGECSWSQREIERRTGIPQSTISGQKSYLVKSLKLVIEEHDGKLKLVEDVGPAMWKTDHALVGFPRPEQVWRWWSGEDDPPDPETPGQTHETPGKHDSNGAKGDRGRAGHLSEESGHPAQNEADHRDDRPENHGDRRNPGQENPLDKEENASQGEPTEVTGGFQDYEGKVCEESGERSHDAGNAEHDEQEDPLTKKERLLGPGWESETPRTILAKLGWTRDPNVTSDNRPETSGSLEESAPGIKRDPVARKVQRLAFLNWQRVITAAELLEEGQKGKDAEELRSMGWPATPQEMHEHLRSVAPMLQGAHPAYESYPVQWDYSIRVEYWTKASSGEGLWVFVKAHQGNVDEEENEKYVWWEVERLEGLDDDDFEFYD